MEGMIGDFILSLGIKIFHKMEKLTEKELKAQKEYLVKRDIDIRRETKKPLIVGIVGLIGSGKTAIAKKLAPLIGAKVVFGDDIRVCLRKEKEKYENARLIAENIAMEIINKGGTVVIDSDFIDQKKRISLKEKAKKVGAKVVFIRTYADLDVVVGRIMDVDHKDITDDFFGGASSAWQGANKGAVVKLREMHRRLPHHYRWVNESGGKWVLKKLSFKVFAEIDTSNEDKWKQEIKMIAEQICIKY